MSNWGGVTVNGYGDSASIDAFARLRVSNPVTIFDSKQIFDNAPLFWDDQEVSGSGTTSTHSTAEARTQLAVSNTTAGNRTRQTFMRHNYQPGKSQLVFMTTRMSTGGTGITAAVGLFDDDNGLFFINDEGTLKAVQRSNATGSPVDTAISQTSWNLDTMNGSGDSGVTIDPSKTQILFIDFEWLGVGRVRMGFVIDGLPVYCHEFLNTNNLSVVYMSTPNLPIRYELTNDGTGAATTMDHICSTVISEGGSQNNGLLFYKSTEGTHIDCNTDNTLYALMGIRLKSTHLAASILLERASIQIQTASENAEWCWVWNPTVTGTFTYANITNSAVMVAVASGSGPTVSGGTTSTGGFAESTSGGGGSGGVTSPISNARLLGSAIDGTVDELVLCYRPVGGSTNHDVEAGITWRELV